MFFTLFQLAIVIVGPGPAPRWRQGIVRVESGHDILIPDDKIFDKLDKALAPIIIGWNGRDHYLPTIHLTAPELEQWNLDCLIVFGQASLDIIEAMDRMNLSDIAKNKLSELKVCLKSTVGYFSSTPFPPLAKKKAKPNRKEVPSSLISILVQLALAEEVLLEVTGEVQVGLVPVQNLCLAVL